MVRTLVLRGLLAGLVAGLLAGAFAFAFGEPLVDDAIKLEEAGHVHASAEAGAAHDHGGGHDHEAGAVSRTGQKGGLFLATAAAGLALGGLLAAAFAVARGRLRFGAGWQLALALAGAAFVAVVLLPFVKYPANPPAVGDPDTITERTLSYLALLGCGLAAWIAAVRVSRTARREDRPWQAPLAGGATYVAVAALALALLPAVEEVPADFPAQLLWEFRITSLGVQAVLWSVLGCAFALLTARAEERAATT